MACSIVQWPDVNLVGTFFGWIGRLLMMIEMEIENILLTEAILPVAETAETVRPDCRRALLNIVIEIQRVCGRGSLKKMVNWGRGRAGWMGRRRKENVE